MTDPVISHPHGGRAASPSVGAEARRLLARAQDLRNRVGLVLEADTEPRRAVETAFAALRREMVRRDLAAIPIERLKDSTAGRLRLGPLAAAGFRSVLDVLDATQAALLMVPGVGQQTVIQIVGAARQVAAAVDDGLKVRVDLDPANDRSTALLMALYRLDAVQKTVERLRELVTAVGASVTVDIPTARPTRGRLRWFFTGSS